MECYISFFEFIVEGIDLVVKSCGSDFSSFIEEVDGEQTSLSTLIMPLFDLGLISHANSDRPSTINHTSRLDILVLIWRETFNRVHGDISTDISNTRKWGNTEKVELVGPAAVEVRVAVVAVLVHTYLCRP